MQRHQFLHGLAAAFAALCLAAPATGFAQGYPNKPIRLVVPFPAAVFIVWMLKSHAGQKLFSFAMACILGGAIGNVVDRMMHGYVVDFLSFHAGGWYFPAFNAADSAITLGAICLILDEIRRVRRGK